MTRVLSVNNDDLDEFEEALENFLEKATPAEVRKAVEQATIFIENLADNPATMSYNYTQLNNATSLFNHVARVYVK